MPFIFDVPPQTQIDALYQQWMVTHATPGVFGRMYETTTC